ncbi:MAG: hypothetical protein ACI9BD_000260 [Candidatus Marinamargulisbacteria bacterium]|jgi:hypothetical protein
MAMLHKKIPLYTDPGSQIILAEVGDTVFVQKNGVQISLTKVNGDLLEVGLEFQDHSAFLANMTRHMTFTSRGISFKLHEKGYSRCMISLKDLSENRGGLSKVLRRLVSISSQVEKDAAYLVQLEMAPPGSSFNKEDSFYALAPVRRLGSLDRSVSVDEQLSEAKRPEPRIPPPLNLGVRARSGFSMWSPQARSAAPLWGELESPLDSVNEAVELPSRKALDRILTSLLSHRIGSPKLQHSDSFNNLLGF